MASSAYNGEVRGVLRDGEIGDQPADDVIRDVGNNLLTPPSSTDELRTLLLAEAILKRVYQCPTGSTVEALLPAKEALIIDQYLRHGDENVQIIVASCLNEIVRISAPDQPYEDDQMKGVFQLFKSGLKHLLFESRGNFYRAMRMVAVLVILRACLVLMDLDRDATIELFPLFFSLIRGHHPATVRLFKFLEWGMTLMIEEFEDDEISPEILRPLLDSVKLNNEDDRTQYLGECVIQQCSTKLQPHIKEYVKSLNLKVEDYVGTIASLCQDETSKGNMEAEEDCTSQVNNISTVNHVGEEHVAVAQSGDGVSKLGGDGEGNLLHDEN